MPDSHSLGRFQELTHSLARQDRSVRAPIWLVPAAGLLVMAACLGGASGCADSRARVEAFRTGRATTRATGDLRRGINFGDAMDAPHEGDWGWVISASDFVAVHDAGFDHVRVPMRFSAHVDTSPPFRVDGRFFKRVDWVIAQALSNDLGVIVDLHHFQE